MQEIIREWNDRLSGKWIKKVESGPFDWYGEDARYDRVFNQINCKWWRNFYTGDGRKITLTITMDSPEDTTAEFSLTTDINDEVRVQQWITDFEDVLREKLQ